jgi:hypothetical protein
MILIFIYIIISAVIGIHSWSGSGFAVGGSILLSSLLAFIAGSGLRGSFNSSTTKPQKIVGLMLAFVSMVIADWLGGNYHIQIFGIGMTGDLWVWVGLLICVIFTKKNEDNSDLDTNGTQH